MLPPCSYSESTSTPHVIQLSRTYPTTAHAREFLLSLRTIGLLMLLATLSAAIGIAAAWLLQSDAMSTPDVTSQTQPARDIATASPAQTLSQQVQSTEPAPQASAPAATEQPSPASQVGQPAPAAAATEPQSAPLIQQQEQPQSRDEEAPTSASTIELLPDTLRQGEVLSIFVRHDTATAVVATAQGHSWNLTQQQPNTWWSILAIPRDSEVGPSPVSVDFYGPNGWLESSVAVVQLLANDAPHEDIILDSDGETPDPVAVERDHAVRFLEHVAVSGPPRWREAWRLPVIGEPSGAFGARRSYDGQPSDQWHHGHDIAAQHGDPITAPAPARVVWTGDLVLHGMGVILDHGAGVYSGYWHMSQIGVRVGFDVTPGDWLGNIGTTGLSTGPHLHWEVIVRGVDVDPLQWVGQRVPALPAADESEALDTID